MEKPEQPTQTAINNKPAAAEASNHTANNTEQKSLFDMHVQQIKRIMKNVFPEKAMVSKNAVDIVTRASTLFILYIADLTMETVHRNKRVIANGGDLLEALKKAGFEEMTESVKKAMEEQTEHIKELNAVKKQKLMTKDPAKETKTETTNNK